MKIQMYVTLRSLHFIFLYMSVFFEITSKCLFRHTYFNRQLAAHLRVIIQFAKLFWSRKDEIIHCFGSSSVASLPVKQQKFEVESLLEIKIPRSTFHYLRTVKIQFLECTWIYLPTFG